MRWLNKYKKILLAIVFIVCLALIALVMTSRFIGCVSTYCTSGLLIEIIGLPAPSNYKVEITFPSGESRTLTCEPSAPNKQEPEGVVFTEESLNNSQWFGKGRYCIPPNQAFFYLSSEDDDKFPPEKITVTTTVNEKRDSRTFYPLYEEIQTDGRYNSSCAPACYNALVTIDLNALPRPPVTWWDKNKATVLYIFAGILCLALFLLVFRRYNSASSS